MYCQIFAEDRQKYSFENEEQEMFTVEEVEYWQWPE